MSILGVDPGERRVGFAICEDGMSFAIPLKVAPVRSSEQILQTIIATASEVNAQKIILGYPVDMSGRRGPKAKEAEALCEKLHEQGLDVTLWDERLSTAEADRVLKNANFNRKERKKVVDSIAAQRILESWLTANQ